MYKYHHAKQICSVKLEPTSPNTKRYDAVYGVERAQA